MTGRADVYTPSAEDARTSAERPAPSARACRWRDAGRYEAPGVCRWCGVSVPKPRRFCSDPQCKVEVRIRAEPRFARRMVGRRDRGVCQVCGCDTLKLYRILRWVEDRSGYDAAKEIWLALGFHGDYRSAGNRWQMDHIKPVIEGGGKCGLDNLRCVCTPCHKEITAALVRRRAGQKFYEKLNLQLQE